MLRVHVLSARTPKAYNITYPLRAFRRQLRRRGLAVRFYWQADPSLTACDALIVLSEHWKDQRASHSGESVLDRLRRYRDGASTLIWLDTSDSSGTTSFEVLPYVDLYAKNQLLRDRTGYTRPFYGLRSYTDFYHRHHRIDDTRDAGRTPATAGHLHKLAVSWNLGLGSYVQRSRELSSSLGRLRFYLPVGTYAWHQTPPGCDGRGIDVSFRGRLEYDRDTLTFQRRETQRRLAAFAAQSGCTVASVGRLPYRAYRQELRRSKVVLSPFGFGEINAGRDFECFTDGAALVKPDMSHLTTWPAYFEAGVTYAAHAWDFSDFDTTLTMLLSDSDQRLRIAQAGQTRYLRSISDAGGDSFAEHLQNLVEQAGRHSTQRSDH